MCLISDWYLSLIFKLIKFVFGVMNWAGEFNGLEVVLFRKRIEIGIFDSLSFNFNFYYLLPNVVEVF